IAIRKDVTEKTIGRPKKPSTRRRKSLTTLPRRAYSNFRPHRGGCRGRSPAMSRPQAVPLPLSPRQQALLQRLVRRHTADQRLVRRGPCLLALAAGPRRRATPPRAGRHWRDRWLQAAPRLLQAEQAQASAAALAGLIEQVLADAPRPGAPATFGPEQIVRLVAVACEPPEPSGRPIDRWTSREL